MKLIIIALLFCLLYYQGKAQTDTSYKDTIIQAQLDPCNTSIETSDRFIIHNGEVYFSCNYLIAFLFDGNAEMIWFILDKALAILDEQKQMLDMENNRINK